MWYLCFYFSNRQGIKSEYWLCVCGWDHICGRNIAFIFTLPHLDFQHWEITLHKIIFTFSFLDIHDLCCISNLSFQSFSMLCVEAATLCCCMLHLPSSKYMRQEEDIVFQWEGMLWLIIQEPCCHHGSTMFHAPSLTPTAELTYWTMALPFGCHHVPGSNYKICISDCGLLLLHSTWRWQLK
jgi:hypothetical protein